MQCNCWAEAKKKVNILKAEKCETNQAKKAVKANKVKCREVFKICKKIEDESVKLIYNCMHRQINQTAKGLHGEIAKAVTKTLAQLEETAKKVLDGEPDEIKQLQLYS